MPICSILISLEPKTGLMFSPGNRRRPHPSARSWDERPLIGLLAGVATVCARSSFDRHPARVRDPLSKMARMGAPDELRWSVAPTWGF
jgi:hypothetical protein